MPRWTSRFIDKRAISNEGQWGEYVCERCGKHFMARMCTKKKVKHVYCSTKCKKDSQVRYDRPIITKAVYKKIYDENYEIVKIISFKCLEGKHLDLLEDCMQEGFIELWRTYNRNKMSCPKSYIRKAIKHAILDKLHYWLIQERRYEYVGDLKMLDKIIKKC